MNGSKIPRQVTGFPDLDTNYVYEHQRYFLSKTRTMPWIRARIEDGALVVTAGHKYLRAAKELGRATIRAAIDAASDQSALEDLLKRRGGRELARRELDDDVRPVKEWHVFFFSGPLNEKAQHAFREIVMPCFDRRASALLDALEDWQPPYLEFGHRGETAEVEAFTPVVDEAWIRRFVEAQRRVNEEVAPITTYRGRKFGQ